MWDSYVRNLWLHWIFDWIADIAAVCFFFWSDSVHGWDPRGSGWCQMFREGAGARKGPCQASKRFDFKKKNARKKNITRQPSGDYTSPLHTKKNVSNLRKNITVHRFRGLHLQMPIFIRHRSGAKDWTKRRVFQEPRQQGRLWASMVGLKSAVIYGILRLFWSPPILWLRTSVVKTPRF